MSVFVFFAFLLGFLACIIFWIEGRLSDAKYKKNLADSFNLKSSIMCVLCRYELKVPIAHGIGGWKKEVVDICCGTVSVGNNSYINDIRLQFVRPVYFHKTIKSNFYKDREGNERCVFSRKIIGDDDDL